MDNNSVCAATLCNKKIQGKSHWYIEIGSQTLDSVNDHRNIFWFCSQDCLDDIYDYIIGKNASGVKKSK